VKIAAETHGVSFYAERERLISPILKLQKIPEQRKIQDGIGRRQHKDDGN